MLVRTLATTDTPHVHNPSSLFGGPPPLPCAVHTYTLHPGSDTQAQMLRIIAWSDTVFTALPPQALSSAPSLRVLDLSGNNLSDGSAIVLVSSLRLNPALELLMLRDNPLGQCGTRILLRALAAGAGGWVGGWAAQA